VANEVKKKRKFGKEAPFHSKKKGKEMKVSGFQIKRGAPRGGQVHVNVSWGQDSEEGGGIRTERV